MGWLLAGLAAVVLWWFLSRIRSYRRLFALAHQMEFGQALARLKHAAMRDVIAGDGWDALSSDDARILRTSAGLVFVYTVSIGPAAHYVHHASVSVPGGVTAHAVGETFILLWTRLIGIGYERLVLETSPALVHHAEFVLDEEEQARFAQRLVEAPTIDMLKAFGAECVTARQNLRRRSGSAAAGPA